MKFDLNKSRFGNTNDTKYKFAIIGAGAAGVTIARKLAEKGHNVALMEGGEDGFTEDSQNLYKAKVVGDPYFELDHCRLRMFGGSTNCWGGLCREFENIDFQRGNFGPEFQWPIVKSDIDKYINEASDILDIDLIKGDKTLENAGLKEVFFDTSPPTNFLDKYYEEIVSNKKINLFLNANLIDINVNQGKINSAIFESYKGTKININAENFIFCMGGIENPRFLLHFRNKYGDEFFPNKLPVGKYWMEHPHANLGLFLMYGDLEQEFERYFTLSDEMQKKLSVFGCGLRLKSRRIASNDVKEHIREILCLAPKLGKKLADKFKLNLVCSGELNVAWEQAPDIRNKIVLSSETDRFKIPKPILQWKKLPMDTKTLKETVSEFNRWLLKNDIGRIKLNEWVLNNYDYSYNYDRSLLVDGINGNDGHIGGPHHMGGTRMHKDPSYGVVDSDCKMFGTKNVYMAGSSVFTTGGHNNPTLPIIQFALRLAEHLA